MKWNNVKEKTFDKKSFEEFLLIAKEKESILKNLSEKEIEVASKTIEKTIDHTLLTLMIYLQKELQLLDYHIAGSLWILLNRLIEEWHKECPEQEIYEVLDHMESYQKECWEKGLIKKEEFYLKKKKPSGLKEKKIETITFDGEVLDRIDGEMLNLIIALEEKLPLSSSQLVIGMWASLNVIIFKLKYGYSEIVIQEMLDKIKEMK